MASIINEDRTDKYFYSRYPHRLYHLVDTSQQGVSLPCSHGWCNFILYNMPDNLLERIKIDHRIVRTKDLFDALNNGSDMASVSFYLSLPVTVRVDQVCIIDNQIWYLFDTCKKDKDDAKDFVGIVKTVYIKCLSLLSLSAMPGSDVKQKETTKYQEIITPLDTYCKDCFISLPYTWGIYSIGERAFVLICGHSIFWIRNPVLSNQKIAHIDISSFRKPTSNIIYQGIHEI